MTGRIWINDGKTSKPIFPKDLAYYESLGWKKGRIRSANIWIHKDSVGKMTSQDELEKYLADGWVLGMPPKKKK